MQHYTNLTNCIKMCERILKTDSVYNGTTFKSKYDQPDMLIKPYVPRDPFTLSVTHSYQNGIPRNAFRPPTLTANYLSSTKFHPSRTVVVLNFQPEAETHVKSLVSRFGVIEICETIKEEDTPSCLAVIQYMEVTSALNALLALPDCKVRGMNLVVQLLWNGSYDLGDYETNNSSFKECTEKRIVCVGKLPRNITRELIYMKCCRYGYVDDIRIQQQEQEAFAYVAFRSPLSAAVATYCLRNSSRSSAALVMGYRADNSPYLDGPVRVRTLDQYTLPLAAFDVNCIIERFKEYSKLKGLFINLHRKLPLNYFFRPGSSEYCVRIPTTLAKGVSLFIEVLLFQNKSLKKGEEITDAEYNACNQKYLFRFSVDFGLNKPITPQNERLSRLSPLIRWHSFFVLDLQVCCTVAMEKRSGLRLSPRIQGMNHVYSDVNAKLDTDSLTSLWFGLALRHSCYNLDDDDVDHESKIRFIVGTNLPFVRLLGSLDELNSYQIPVHVFSDVQGDGKS